MKIKKTAPTKGAVMKKHSKSALLMEVIAVQTCIGDGTEQNPNRIITEYWSKDGKLIAVNHPYFNSSLHLPSLD